MGLEKEPELEGGIEFGAKVRVSRMARGAYRDAAGSSKCITQG